MENTTPIAGGDSPEIKTPQSIIYIHGRRVIITLVVALLIVGIFGILYYNGKIVYENGL